MGPDRRTRSPTLPPVAPARRCTYKDKPSVEQRLPLVIREMVGRDRRARREEQQTPNAQRPTLNVQFTGRFLHRCPTKYKRGNKKTHTISTKCQYSPAISTVL